RNVIAILTQKVGEVFEQNIKSEFVSAIELLKRQMEDVFTEVTGLQHAVQSIQQTATETSDQDLKGEILTATAELLNQRYEGVSNDVKNLQDAIHLHAQKESELLKQEIRSDMLATAESLNQRYDDISQQLTSQQRLLEKISRMLGF
ncbi:hypothetical protein AB4Z22_16610, partial [Paenibacillus sp. TAF58]